MLNNNLLLIKEKGITFYYTPLKDGIVSHAFYMRDNDFTNIELPLTVGERGSGAEVEISTLNIQIVLPVYFIKVPESVR